MKNTITTTWENLIESLVALEDDLRSSNLKQSESHAASVHTLALALTGLGRAWQQVERQIPDATPSDENDNRYTSQRALVRPLARALLELGRTTPSAAIQRVGEIMGDTLTAGDRGLLPKSRLVRWENNVRFARDILRQRGFLVPPDGSSRWKLTPEGEKWARTPDAPLPEAPEKSDPNQSTFTF